jgi:hypothetical protein
MQKSQQPGNFSTVRRLVLYRAVFRDTEYFDQILSDLCLPSGIDVIVLPVVLPDPDEAKNGTT